MSKRSANFISAFEFDVIRDAFRHSVVENSVPPQEWQRHAADFVRSFIGIEASAEVLAALLDVRTKKSPPAEADGPNAGLE
ncbi:hypothetical protein [Mesorhizobium sp.]|nr:hypothetical protein [Mesorhizobium sp.]RWG02586.1 MAG: hypothetical protein EOQ54_19735 [Mesorhizobium sp.]RWH00783.1 MAG: hypothetical protein EOQ72_09285 [Mesorhizobium sp.]TIN20574.1 MAG: hypothetical protein E5Y51_02255 [Mesorhizobium sp.]TIN47604.1 MAG: hypothetical protein E5Y25_05290 [Mesorhizobium sp.]TIR92657.1 MAG: hypothetical protein E5X08_13415 [Mesorhizobium sp.]